MTQLNFHTPISSPPPGQSSSNIPIVQKVATAYKLWHGYLSHFPRLSRYTLGAKIDTLFSEVLELVLFACYAERAQKTTIVIRTSTKLDALKFFLHIAWELKTLDNKKYIHLSAMLVEIGKMIGGWRKQLHIETPPS